MRHTRWGVARGLLSRMGVGAPPRCVGSLGPVAGLSSSAATGCVIDIATEADIKSGSVAGTADSAQDESGVLLAESRVAWQERQGARPQSLAVETSQLFCASNNPLHHEPSDVGRFFQLDGQQSTAFEHVFYHTGLCGGKVMDRARALQSSAMMVRARGLAVRDELLGLERDGQLGEASGMLLHGSAGVGKSMVLNYVVAALHEAGWLIACIPQAADWTIGLSARSAQFANEAYRLTDRNYFSELPPELADSPLYEAPDASANFVLSLYLSQREKLEKIRVKGAERSEFYAPHATDQQSGPSVADMLRPYVEDQRKAFSDFPLPARPVYDVLAELQLVTEFPTLLVIDNFDAFDRMATSCQWQECAATTGRPPHPAPLRAVLPPHDCPDSRRPPSPPLPPALPSTPLPIQRPLDRVSATQENATPCLGGVQGRRTSDPACSSPLAFSPSPCCLALLVPFLPPAYASFVPSCAEC